MKKSKFTEQQIIFALNQSETGVTLGEILNRLTAAFGTSV
jgi:hypothetical protein